MAGPLPGRRGRLDPPERADARAGDGNDPGRAQGPVGRAGREPLQPPDRRLCQRDPARPAAARLRRVRPKAPRVHAMLETHIRGEKKALLANLRAFPPRGTINEVWNHGVYKYVATYQAIPGRGPRAVKVAVELHANSGSMLNGQDDKDRVVNYEYSLVYGLDGRVDETNPAAADWISVGGEALFAPLNVLELVESRWGGHNQLVTEANVRSLDLANGGGKRGRFAMRSASSGRSLNTRPAALG